MALSEQEELELLRLRKQRASAAPERRTPEPMKIGAEGFGQAFEKEFKSRSGFERGLAAAGSFPRQLYEGAKQMFGREDKQAIEAVRVMEREEPVSAVLGGAASLIPLSRIPGVNTVAGAASLGAMTGALTPTQGGESRLQNTLVGGAVGGGVQKGLNLASIPLSRIFKGAEEQAMSRASQQSVRDATIKEAQAAGKETDKDLAGDIRQLLTADLEALFPATTDRKLVKDLINKIDRATTHNERVTAFKAFTAMASVTAVKGFKEAFWIAKKLVA